LCADPTGADWKGDPVIREQYLAFQAIRPATGAPKVRQPTATGAPAGGTSLTSSPESLAHADALSSPIVANASAGQVEQRTNLAEKSVGASNTTSVTSASAHLGASAGAGDERADPQNGSTTQGKCRRKDSMPPPSVAEANSWSMKPYGLLCDAAPAAASSTIDAFDPEEEELQVMFCMVTHALG